MSISYQISFHQCQEGMFPTAAYPPPDTWARIMSHIRIRKCPIQAWKCPTSSHSGHRNIHYQTSYLSWSMIQSTCDYIDRRWHVYKKLHFRESYWAMPIPYTGRGIMSFAGASERCFRYLRGMSRQHAHAIDFSPLCGRSHDDGVPSKDGRPHVTGRLPLMGHPTRARHHVRGTILEPPWNPLSIRIVMIPPVHSEAMIRCTKVASRGPKAVVRSSKL